MSIKQPPLYFGFNTEYLNESKLSQLTKNSAEKEYNE